MNVVVIGFGKSGQAAAELAKKCGHSVTIVDENISETMLEVRAIFEKKGIHVDLGVDSCDFNDVSTIIQSPGIPNESLLAILAAASGIEVISEIEFAAMNTDIPLLAVTGTNGKTTTTELTTHLLSALGYKVCAVGNIGTTLSEIVSSPKKYDFLVLELSSFQLEKSPRLTPKAAVITNITPDHLDRHGDMDSYAKIKFSVFNNIGDELNKIINENLFAYCNENIAPLDLPILFSATAEADYRLDDGHIVLDDKQIISLAETKLRGPHNAENIMAALALVAAAVGDDKLFSTKVAKALKSFSAGDHRIEVFLEKNGITFIDDSKGTNPDAVTAAVNAVAGEKNVCLILGGLDKGMDFSAIKTVAGKIKSAFVIGECQQKISNELKEVIECQCYDDFKSAVAAATARAEEGDVVLLSPACASMDMFKSYKERGDIFKHLIRDLV